MGVERPNVVLYTLGGPRGSSGLRILLSYLYPHFIFRRLLCRPYPPFHPLPCFSGSSLLGWVSLSPFLLPLPFGSPEAKNLPALSLFLSASARPWGRRRAGRRVAAVDEGGWGGRVIFFRGHRGGGWMIFATISLGKSIPTPGSQAGRLTPLCDLASAARNTE